MNNNQYSQSTPIPFPFPFNSFAYPKGASMIPNMMGMDYLEHQNAVGRAQANIQGTLQANANMDSLLHVHRRKLQRRAANRKSAQLSRARKKAHLEELKIENVRLQTLVDVLDSQPELVFCITACGDLTYISERTVNFINVDGADTDEDPSHISQILAPDSVDSVLKTIREIMRISPPKSALSESSMLFSAKEVKFQDAFGNPLVGSLRCARVNRRPAIDDVVVDDDDSLSGAPPVPTPPLPAKKGKAAKAAQAEAAALAAAAAAANQMHQQGMAHPVATYLAGSNMQVKPPGDWNLTNFQMLTNCVSNMTEDHDKLQRSHPFATSDASAMMHEPFPHLLAANTTTRLPATSTSSNSSRSLTDPSPASHTTHSTNSSGTKNNTTTVNPAAPTSTANPLEINADEVDSEFVCVIRTSDSYFARYSTRSDLYMFVSTPLSTASMEAHDLKPGNGIARHASLGVANLPVQAQPGASAVEVKNETGHKRKANSSSGGSAKSSLSRSGSQSGSRPGSNAGSVTNGGGSGNGSGNESISVVPKSTGSSENVYKNGITSSEGGSDDNNAGENGSL